MAIMVAMKLRQPSDDTAGPHVLAVEHNKCHLQDLETMPMDSGSNIALRMKTANNSGVLSSNTSKVLSIDAENPDIIPHNTGQLIILCKIIIS